MDFLMKLDQLMKQNNLNKHTLASQCGVPYTTIVGLYERGADNARLSTLNRLADFFSVPLDYLVVDKYEKPEDFIPGSNTPLPSGSPLQSRLVNLFLHLNMEGQEKLVEYADDLVSSGKYIKSDPSVVGQS